MAMSPYASPGGGRARMLWQLKMLWPLKLGVFLVLVLVLWLIDSQPSEHLRPSPHRTVRYNGVKDFLVCPQETSVSQFHGRTDGPSVFSMLSPRCRELARILQLSKHIINQILLVGAEQLDAGTRFEDLCDSLDKKEIMMAFQKQFNVTISDELISKIATLGDAAGIIEELRFNDGFLTPVALYYTSRLW
ncbi:hypothetical protein R1flu_013465 [Riccia fluitans]|uniref:Carrier domain-containing protein n=1 Tax=Riccia fluitans TaxID=41844 RepID=A0ABD1YGW6_9MARC